MDLLYALILGIVEGITEFLPISSTGHLIVSEELIGFKDDTAIFTVVIQLGAIAAAAWYFRLDLINICKKCLAGDKQMQKFARNVFVGLLPAGIIGLIVEKTVGLPDSLALIGATMILGGFIFLFVESKVTAKTNKAENMDYGSVTLGRSLIVGFAQCLALIPGVSRSGATIVSGLATGLDRKTAAVFSFYLSIPIMLAASVFKLYEGSSELQNISGGVPALLVGLASATITAFFVIKWLMKYIQTNTFKPFAYYRIFMGSLIIIVLLIS